MYNEQQREWTPEQLAEAAQDALDNWEWDVYLEIGDGDDGITSAELEERRDDRKSIIEGMTDAEANRTSYADDDGVIRIEPQYGNIWHWLDERMESSYSSWLLVK